MRIPFKPLLTLLCISGCIAPAISSAAMNNDEAAQLNSLESQVNNLQQEIKVLKKHRPTKSVQVDRIPIHHPTYAHRLASDAVADQMAQNTHSTPVSTLSGKDVSKLISSQEEYLPFDLDVPGQAFVSTGPYVGVPIQFAGSDLIINSPSVNTDLQLLNIRSEISKQLTAMGGELFKEPYHSHLLLSGLVEAQAYHNDMAGPANDGEPSSNIDLSAVNLDAFFLGPSEWTLGFIEFAYDNSPPSGSVFTSTSNYTVYNSRMLVNKAFITIGDLSKSPFYGTIGQYYVPFGTFSSFMVSDPLTKDLGRTKARAIEIGFQPQITDTFYGSIFAFRGDAHATTIDKINNGGVNLGYKFDAGFLSGNIGGGWLSNIADSAGLQVGNNFQQYEQLVHRVAAWDARANINFGPHIDFVGEYIVSATNFNKTDMSYNGHGATPKALDLEGAYSFDAWGRPNSIGLAYDKSQEALAMGLPSARYALVFATSIWRNTLQSLEVRHDREYSSGDTATTANNGVNTNHIGSSDNAVTAQFDYFF